MDDINATTYKLAESFQKRYNTNMTSPVGEKYYADQLLSYLKGQLDGGLKSLPKELRFYAHELNQELETKHWELGIPNESVGFWIRDSDDPQPFRESWKYWEIRD